MLLKHTIAWWVLTHLTKPTFIVDIAWNIAFPEQEIDQSHLKKEDL